MSAAPERICANPNCTEGPDGQPKPLPSSMKATAKTCSPSCRAEKSRVEKGQTPLLPGRGIWRGFAGVTRRRPASRGPRPPATT